MTKLLEKAESRAMEQSDADATWLDQFCEESANSQATGESGERAQPNDAPRVGVLVGFNEAGYALVDFRNNPTPEPLPARATVLMERKDIAREVVLLFEENDLRRPIVAGLLQPPKPELGESSIDVEAMDTGPATLEVNGQRIMLTGEKELVLRCGAASIVLTRAGKILIRGAYLLSRSSGVNFIKGGSVQIN